MSILDNYEEEKILDVFTDVAARSSRSCAICRLRRGVVMSTLESLWGAAQKAVSDTVDSTGKVASDAISSTGKAISSAVESTTRAVQSSVESKAMLVIDTALDTKDSAIGSVVSGVGSSWDVLAGVVKSPFVGLGISIGMWIAPVPVGVGLGMFWLIDSQFAGTQSRITSEIEGAKQRRTRERVVGLLQKYGEIPETAVIKTAMLSVELNSKTGEVTGDVLAGGFKGTKIEDLDFHGLHQVKESCGNDTESRQVLEAIEHLRKTRLQGLTQQ